VYFKKECSIRDFVLREREFLRFSWLLNDRDVSVFIRCPNKKEQAKGFKFNNAICVVSFEAKPSSKNGRVFGDIENNSIIGDNRWIMKYKDKEGNEIMLPDFSKFPGYFQSFVDQITDDLHRAVCLSVNAIRWRKGILGPHQPMSPRGCFWSRNKIFWNPMPKSIQVYVDVPSTESFSTGERKDVRKILKAELEEPVYHEMYREAWAQRRVNPRSSLVIAVSALEVAVKNMVSSVAPQTKWLVDNLSSPPIVKILKDYLPSLVVENTIGGGVQALPESVIGEIKKVVNVRNNVVHKGAHSLKYERLEEFLTTIRDVIWLMDFYSGQSWAYDHISLGVRGQLERKEQ